MKKIILASSNPHKAKEISHILGVEVLCAKDFVKDFNPIENGASFKQNAKIKAKALWEKLENKEDYMVLSDDSGLCVDELDKNPGIYSARWDDKNEFSGTQDEKNRKKLSNELNKKGLTSSKAAFICVLCLMYDDKMEFFKGVLDGVVIDKERGENGFGYDSMFLVKDHTLAELSESEKNQISHRYKALKLACEFLEENNLR